MLTMCIADIICTTIILLVTLLRYTGVREELSVALNGILCRSLVFAVNTAAALGFVVERNANIFYCSMWLWLAMSTQRYVALLHSHRYRNRTLLVRPVFVVAVLIFSICTGWLKTKVQSIHALFSKRVAVSANRLQQQVPRM